MERGEGWLDLDQHDRKTVFWVIAVLLSPVALALASAVWFGLVLVGAWLGLWHLEMDR
jgi:hypothetical protein